MAVEAVLFDLDGTLVDSLPLIIHTYRRVFDEMQIPWGDDDVVKMIGLPLLDIGRHFTGDAAELFCERYQHYYYQEHDRYIKLFPGTLEMLACLKDSGLQLGIVTSKGKPGTARATAFTGIDRYMDVVITAHDVAKHKPEPEPIWQALAAINTDATNAVYIGDTKYDILCGKNAGCLTLGVSWGLDSPEELKSLQPAGILAEWGDLPAYLK